jgi:hypothetical protein
MDALLLGIITNPASGTKYYEITLLYQTKKCTHVLLTAKQMIALCDIV